MAGQRYPSVNSKLTPFRVVKAQQFKSDDRIKNHGLDRKTNQRVPQYQNGRMTGASLEVPSRDDGLKGNLTLSKVHEISHLKASIPEVSQGDHN